MAVLTKRKLALKINNQKNVAAARQNIYFSYLSSFTTVNLAVIQEEGFETKKKQNGPFFSFRLRPSQVEKAKKNSPPNETVTTMATHLLCKLHLRSLPGMLGKMAINIFSNMKRIKIETCSIYFVSRHVYKVWEYLNSFLKEYYIIIIIVVFRELYTSPNYTGQC